MQISLKPCLKMLEMGSPLGPLLANVLMCHLANQLGQKSMIPSFYRRYVDDTLVTMPNTESATDGSIPFLRTVLTRCGGTLTTEVYRKPTYTGLLLHFQSHVDSRDKKGLVNTMVNRAYRLSSTKEGFAKEWNKLRTIFSKLRDPKTLVGSTINKFSQEPDEEIHTVPL